MRRVSRSRIVEVSAMPAEGIKEGVVEGFIANGDPANGDVQANGSNGEYHAPAVPVDDDPAPLEGDQPGQGRAHR